MIDRWWVVAPGYYPILSIQRSESKAVLHHVRTIASCFGVLITWQGAATGPIEKDIRNICRTRDYTRAARGCNQAERLRPNGVDPSSTLANRSADLIFVRAHNAYFKTIHGDVNSTLPTRNCGSCMRPCKFVFRIRTGG